MESQVPNTERIIQSRMGKRPLAIPSGVSVSLKDSRLEVQGPKGKLSRTIPNGIDIKIVDGNALVTSTLPGRDAPRLQGLVRALLAGMLKGAAEGYTKVLELRGTGYRAELKGQDLTMSLGLSHQVRFSVPAGLSATIPGDSKGAVLVLSGPDKELIGRTAATIRSFRPPEPYAGKGVRYQGEKVREKAGKAGKGGKK